MWVSSAGLILRSEPRRDVLSCGMRTLFLTSLICLLANVAVAQPPLITIATWSGSYGIAQEIEVFKPFSRKTGVTIRIARNDGDLLPLIKSSGSAPPWQVVDIEHAPLTRGCAEGRFEKLDHAALLGKAALTDFIPGTLHPCGIGQLIWSQVVAYDATQLSTSPPRSLADFFDLARYPGKRGLYSRAEGNLEIALMADDIPREDVYDMLRTTEGLERAFAKLITLSDAAVFWSQGDGPERLLNEGKVIMSTAYAGRFQRPRSGARRPVSLMWTNQLWRTSYWAIPSGSGELAHAQRFISFATDAERLARLAVRLQFGPARKTAMDLVPANTREDLPTARRQFHDALMVDAGFWAEMGPSLEDRFQTWRQSVR